MPGYPFPGAAGSRAVTAGGAPAPKHPAAPKDAGAKPAAKATVKAAPQTAGKAVEPKPAADAAVTALGLSLARITPQLRLRYRLGDDGLRGPVGLGDLLGHGRDALARRGMRGGAKQFVETIDHG